MKYQVAEYTIDTARYRISSGDAAIPAEPKVFDLLVYLIRHRDRVVSREELFREVWDGREVSDATLSNHVKTARKILGDSGELQQTIQTIRGRGYQFIAPVTVIPEGAASPEADKSLAPAPETTPAARPIAPAWRLLLSIAGVLLLVVLLGWYAFVSFQTRSTSDMPYVLVVPFDVSADQPEAWRPFADQATREVIRNLRKISGLRVVPALSAFTFKDNKARDHIKRQLPEIQYVLDGAVSISAGNTLRITVELEDLNRNLVVWDESYEGRTDDTNLFAMQSSIAAAVSDSLKVAIPADERRALDEFPTTNLKAYESYVAGRYQLDLLSHESLPRAIKLFDEAIALDPKFFDAYIARSDSLPAAVLLLRAANQHAAAGGRLALRGAGAAPRFGRGLVFSRPDLCVGLALEGCLDRVEQGEAARPDTRADGTGVCAVLLRARRSGEGQACAGQRRAARPAQRGNGGLGQLGAVHGGRKRGSARVGRSKDAATPGHRDSGFRRRCRRLYRR